MTVAILGAGNWGTTMAVVLARAGHVVTLWEFDVVQAELVARTHVNEKFLPGIPLAPEIRVTSDLSAALADAEIILLAVPAQHCRGVLRRIQRLEWIRHNSQSDEGHRARFALPRVANLPAGTGGFRCRALRGYFRADDRPRSRRRTAHLRRCRLDLHGDGAARTKRVFDPWTYGFTPPTM